MLDEGINFQNNRQDGPFHSTPIKGTKLNVPLKSPSQGPISLRSECTACDVEQMTMQKQRQEIQLLVAELRDRDRELTEMVDSHQQQLQAWEHDRQHMLTLEKKCARFESELSQKRRQLEDALSQMNVLKADQQSHCSALETTSLQLDVANRSRQEQAEALRELQLQNQTLSDSLRELSQKVGRLEAREQELCTVIRQKDEELAESNHIMTDLHQRLTKFENDVRNNQQRESDALTQLTQWKQRYMDLKREYERYSGDMLKKEETLNVFTQQYQEAQQQIAALKDALLLSEEREKHKGEVVQSLKTKQERVEQELRALRQLYERQQRELAMLYLNLDSSRELSLNNSNKDSGDGSPDLLTKDSDSPTKLNKGLMLEKALSCPHNYLKASFEDRLNSFLEMTDKSDDLPAKVASNDSNDANDEVDVDARPGSPASRLQKLLLESRKMIQSLEESAVPSLHNFSIKSASSIYRDLGDSNLNCSVKDSRCESPHHPDSDIEASPSRV